MKTAIGLIFVSSIVFAQSSFAAIDPNPPLDSSEIPSSQDLAGTTSVRRPNTETVVLYDLKTNQICMVKRSTESADMNVQPCTKVQKRTAENLMAHSLPANTRFASLTALAGYYLLCSAIDSYAYQKGENLEAPTNLKAVDRTLELMGFFGSASMAVSACLPVTGINFAIFVAYETVKIPGAL